MGYDSTHVLSAICGWVYTAAWSLSFYPQPLLNWRRKSTSGATIDFPLLNTLGFFAYSVYNALLLYSPAVRREYAHRHHGRTPAVQFNDLVFALHALALCALTTSMYVPGLWWSSIDNNNTGNENRDDDNTSRSSCTSRSRSRSRSTRISGQTRPSIATMAVIGCSTVSVALVGVVSIFSGSDGVQQEEEEEAKLYCWELLDVAYALSFVKMAVTLVKYVPQLLANHRRRSTRGWSVWQVVLDVVGGVLSVTQMILNSSARGGLWTDIAGNPVKFALGNVSMIYDVVFVLQHYVWFPHVAREGGEHETTQEADSEAEGNRDVTIDGPSAPLLGGRV